MMKLFLSIFISLVLFLILLNHKSCLKETHRVEKNINSRIFELDPQTYFPNLSETELEYSFDYSYLINQLNLNKSTFFDLPFVSSIFLQQNIFRSISNTIFTVKYKNLFSEKMKCGDIIFVKTDIIDEFFESFHPRIKQPYILLTHESDYGVGLPWQLKMLDDEKIIMWFGQNILAKHPKLKPLPIGVVAPNGNNFLTLFDMAKNVTAFYDKHNLLYLNFSPNTNKDRGEILAYFQKTFANQSTVKIEQSRISWTKYLDDIKNSKFIISPPGNGIDCHRTWEALIMGSVPIVLTSSLDPLFQDLPVMIVKEWSEVTEENLDKFQRHEMSHFSKDGFPWRPKIWLRYWIKEIMTTRINYIKNNC